MSQNIVITGTNRGIGLELVKQYMQAGHKVWALCRQPSSELQNSGATIIENIDLSSNNFTEIIKEKLAAVSIDLLINNAGILHSETLAEINYQTIEQQFQVNSIAPLKVSEALLPNLKEGSKIALVSSRMGSIADNTSGGLYGYRMSKAALNAAGQSLAQDLKSQGISVAILHPGFVQTDMVNHQGDISAETAASRLKSVIEDLTLENSGSFWHSNGTELPW